MLNPKTLVPNVSHCLVHSGKRLTNMQAIQLHVNASFIKELLACHFSCESGLSCDLVKDYISPTNTCPGNNAGVIRGEPSSKPYLGHVGDVPRYLWDFLADKTSVQKGNTTSVCLEVTSNKADKVCIKAESNKEEHAWSPQPGKTLFAWKWPIRSLAMALTHMKSWLWHWQVSQKFWSKNWEFTEILYQLY